MRQYEPIWEAIKTTGAASLAAPIERHSRIVLAVRKEKTGDTPWNLICLEQGERFRLKHKTEGSLLKFRLVPCEVLNFSKLTTNDL